MVEADAIGDLTNLITAEFRAWAKGGAGLPQPARK
jgi:hypothetical protein